MKPAESFNELYHQISERKLPFLFTFALIVTFSYGFLYVIDFIPEAPTEETEATTEAKTVTQADTSADTQMQSEPGMEVIIPGEESLDERSQTDGDNEPSAPVVAPDAAALPVRIVIDKIDKDVRVLNPTSRRIADLDEALLSGVVRHPDSADFARTGNIFILGHSSYLPTVFNKNFQAFNGIQNLSWGDEIRVYSNDTVYTYRVDDVYEAKASEAFVPNTPGEARLTLATCNTFGSKEDRFMVEASLVDSRPL